MCFPSTVERQKARIYWHLCALADVLPTIVFSPVEDIMTAHRGKFVAYFRRGPCADGSRYQDGPRRHLGRAGVRHSPPLIGDDLKACPTYSSRIYTKKWGAILLRCGARFLRGEGRGQTPLFESMLMSLGIGRRM
jgi:hypothetical protein